MNVGGEIPEESGDKDLRLGMGNDLNRQWIRRVVITDTSIDSGNITWIMVDNMGPGGLDKSVH